MSLDVVYGESRNRTAAVQLAEALKRTVDQGTVYLGYPVLATADDRVEVDALLVSRDHGLVAFLIADSLPETLEDRTRFQDEQDRLYNVLESHLGRHDNLRKRRQLAFTIQTATIFGSPVHFADGEDSFFGDLDQLDDWLARLSSIPPSVEEALHAALQRVTTIKPAKRRASVQAKGSKGAVLKEIERGIANLDRFQKAAAIETPEGPQRIRGLAGSGKTVVLSLKAAYLHSLNPEWNIVLTFHSRALYQQIEDLVTRFSFEHGNDRHDPRRLQILHSWGSSARRGVYSMIATALGVSPRDYTYARATYGVEGAFQGICRELLDLAQQSAPVPIFDAVLIDEAQDLPPEFFQLVYLFTKDPKRIVWGFDELQKLSEAAMPDTDDLFGRGPSGESLVSLASRPDEARRDIVLPVCYRNTPWALATAHSIGLGIYRDSGLLQHPDDPTLWDQIGYNVVHGTLGFGEPVTLQRSSSSYPHYFTELLTPDDAVVCTTFPNEAAQDTWVAQQIARNLAEDELEHDDILIVLPDTYRAKSRAPRLVRTLTREGIPAHVVGVNTSLDEVFVPDSVAIAHIYRAKGNEAPMVYVLDAHYAAQETNAVTRRNTLFTAITRSRAWVRVLGCGPAMDQISHEISEVRRRQFKLEFQIPTRDQLSRLRHIYRGRSPEEVETVRNVERSLEAFFEVYEREEIGLHDLSPAMRTKLARLREEQLDDND